MVEISSSAQDVELQKAAGREVYVGRHWGFAQGVMDEQVQMLPEHLASPSGGELTPFETTHGRYNCDRCKKQNLPIGTSMYGNRVDDYDVCGQCVAAVKVCGFECIADSTDPVQLARHCNTIKAAVEHVLGTQLKSQLPDYKHLASGSKFEVEVKVHTPKTVEIMAGQSDSMIEETTRLLQAATTECIAVYGRQAKEYKDMDDTDENRSQFSSVLATAADSESLLSGIKFAKQNGATQRSQKAAAITVARKNKTMPQHRALRAADPAEADDRVTAARQGGSARREDEKKRERDIAKTNVDETEAKLQRRSELDEIGVKRKATMGKIELVMDPAEVDGMTSATMKEQLQGWKHNYSWPKATLAAKNFQLGKTDELKEKAARCMRLKHVLSVALALDGGQLAKFRVPMDEVEEEAAGDEEDGEEVEDEETEPQ